MKKTYFLIVGFIAMFLGFANVNASSIDYNLRIDNNLHFYETITYNVEKSKVKNGDYYDFLTSVVNDKIYFDLKEEVPYTKTKRSTGNGYIVTLRNDYNSIFLSKSRIVNECFTKSDFEVKTKTISFSASEFSCSHRADNIKVSIVTDLKVTSSNATTVSGNTYTWNNIDSNFEMNFNAETVVDENASEPMDSDGYSQDESSNGNTSSEEVDNNNDSNSNKEKSKKGSLLVNILVILGSLAFIIVITFVYLKTKNNNVNKL